MGEPGLGEVDYYRIYPPDFPEALAWSNVRLPARPWARLAVMLSRSWVASRYRETSRLTDFRLLDFLHIDHCRFFLYAGPEHFVHV